jgi:hypothetical protein
MIPLRIVLLIAGAGWPRAVPPRYPRPLPRPDWRPAKHPPVPPPDFKRRVAEFLRHTQRERAELKAAGAAMLWAA